MESAADVAANAPNKPLQIRSCSGTSHTVDDQLQKRLQHMNHRDMIHAVQHLIEECMLFYMDREECAACLQRHANLKPTITRIVWDELEKANADFFAAYFRRRLERHDRSRIMTSSTPGVSGESQDQKENISLYP